MPGSVTGDPQYWRDRAAKMRALAPTMKDPEVIIQMAHLAADYENLAERAARRSNGLPALRFASIITATDGGDQRDAHTKPWLGNLRHSACFSTGGHCDHVLLSW